MMPLDHMCECHFHIHQNLKGTSHLALRFRYCVCVWVCVMCLCARCVCVCVCVVCVLCVCPTGTDSALLLIVEEVSVKHLKENSRTKIKSAVTEHHIATWARKWNPHWATEQTRLILQPRIFKVTVEPHVQFCTNSSPVLALFGTPFCCHLHMYRRSTRRTGHAQVESKPVLALCCLPHAYSDHDIHFRKQDKGCEKLY